MWRGEAALSRADLFSDPLRAGRDRIWRRVYAAVVTLLFLLMMAGLVWLVVGAFSIEPQSSPTPEQIQQRSEWLARRRAASRVSQTSAAPQGTNTFPRVMNTGPAQPSYHGERTR